MWHVHWPRADMAKECVVHIYMRATSESVQIKTRNVSLLSENARLPFLSVWVLISSCMRLLRIPSPSLTTCNTCQRMNHSINRHLIWRWDFKRCQVLEKYYINCVCVCVCAAHSQTSADSNYMYSNIGTQLEMKGPRHFERQRHIC